MQPKPHWNPYLAGVFLGLVLLASFLVLGFGLGASGATNRLSIGVLSLVAPETVREHPLFSRVAGPGQNPLDDFLVFEVLGVALGGLIGAYSAGRVRAEVAMGPSRVISPVLRLGLAMLGGVVMGFAARLAHGCTSGQALTGGSLLSVGSWVFMLAVFAGGYAFAPLVRRVWR